MTAPVVAVWRNDGDVFVKVGQVPAYTSLSFVPTFLDAGSWSLTAPYDVGASLLPGRLVTIDWRGVRSTWMIDTFNPSQSDGSPTVTVSGSGAKAMLGRCLAWPDATNALAAQPIYLDNRPAPFVGPAETVLRTLTATNFRDRYGAPVNIPSSSGAGSTIRVRPQFDNLFELVQSNAALGGIGFDIGLENTTATRAKLWLRFFTPQDKTKRVRLTSRLGTIAAWEQADTAPTATHALVGYGQTISDVQTTLTADVGPGATTISVASSANFPTPGGSTPTFRVVIDDETLTVTHIAGKTWTVVRGVGVTTGGSHTVGDPVRATRTYRQVTTPTSLAAAAQWGGAREVYVDGPDSKDLDEVDDSGRASLSDGAETRALSVTASEAEGMRAFVHYNVGDIATAEVMTGASAVASITSIEVTVDDSGTTVKPTFGNPGNVNSSLKLGQIIRSLGRAVRKNERK